MHVIGWKYRNRIQVRLHYYFPNRWQPQPCLFTKLLGTTGGGWSAFLWVAHILWPRCNRAQHPRNLAVLHLEKYFCFIRDGFCFFQSVSTSQQQVDLDWTAISQPRAHTGPSFEVGEYDLQLVTHRNGAYVPVRKGGEFVLAYQPRCARSYLILDRTVENACTSRCIYTAFKYVDDDPSEESTACHDKNNMHCLRTMFLSRQHEPQWTPDYWGLRINKKSTTLSPSPLGPKAKISFTVQHVCIIGRPIPYRHARHKHNVRVACRICRPMLLSLLLFLSPKWEGSKVPKHVWILSVYNEWFELSVYWFWLSDILYQASRSNYKTSTSRVTFLQVK